MNNIEFVSFERTPAEKHLGIATIRMTYPDGFFLIRYKIVLMKDGVNIFPGMASYKISDMGMDTYVEAFTVDSRVKEKEISDLIRRNVKQFLNKEHSKPVSNYTETSKNPLPF